MPWGLELLTPNQVGGTPQKPVDVSGMSLIFQVDGESTKSIAVGQMMHFSLSSGFVSGLFKVAGAQTCSSWG